MNTSHKSNGKDLEKERPFKILKFFTFFGFIVMFLGALALSVLNTHWARKTILKKSEDYAMVRVENLNYQIYVRFLAPSYLIHKEKPDLTQKKQYDLLDKVVKITLHSFEVENVNIYYPDRDVILYSYDNDMIGEENHGGKGWINAAKGETASTLVHGGSSWKMFLGIPVSSKIVTYAPLRSEEQTARELSRQFSLLLKKDVTLMPDIIFGVVEIVQDVSADYRNIFEVQKQVIFTSSVIMSVLFLLLYWIVKKGENIVEKRAMEKLKLEEELSRARHLSSLGELTAGISHEIRNPLGVIKSSADLLRKKMAHHELSDAIPTIIVDEADRLNNIITDFLNYAKPQAPDKAPCRIEEIVGKSLTFLDTRIKEQGCSSEFFVSPDPPGIVADFDLLYQAFLNILINALQAMPDGGKISVRIETRNDAVVVLFEDAGTGVTEDLQEKIWNPFFTTKSDGAGLGLGLVKKIIESHNGSIRIENRDDADGARVTVTLPC